jgi:hypothetical protein
MGLPDFLFFLGLLLLAATGDVRQGPSIRALLAAVACNNRGLTLALTIAPAAPAPYGAENCDTSPMVVVVSESPDTADDEYCDREPVLVVVDDRV